LTGDRTEREGAPWYGPASANRRRSPSRGTAAAGS